MNKRGSGVVVAFALGMVWMLTASPASASCNLCDCESSCDQACSTGPDIPDCPECNQSTCGLQGTCIGSWGCQPTGSCQATSCTGTINGTAGGDNLFGTSAHNCINGLGGGDSIDGEAGDDTINCGSGNDTAIGDSGNDCLYGEGDGDNLTGQSGWADFADGGAGSDTCDAETEVNCAP